MVFLIKILMEETDAEHGLTMQEIVQKLDSYGVNADRKTLYLDFEELRTGLDLDILSEKAERTVRYRLASRDFELAELKLLVDSVQAAKFITEKKSDELIKKLEGLVSRHEARQLQRQVLISGRIKTMNESIYYNVDILHAAISSNVQISFQYFNWNVKKEMELRHNGERYRVSPKYLIWDDEYYYLVALDHKSGTDRHYRVDKMLHLELTDIPRDGEAFKNVSAASAFDINAYSKSLFGMFGGETKAVKLEVDNKLAGVIIDRFGKETMIVPKKDKFTCTVNVVVSPQFFGWVLSFGTDMRILSPKGVADEMRKYLSDIGNLY